MSRQVDICDLCETRYPQYHFRRKAYRIFCYGFDSFKESYDICDGCWDRLRVQAIKATAKGKKQKVLSKYECHRGGSIKSFGVEKI